MPKTQQINATEAPYEAQLLQDWLVNGKPELGWRGDPRLSIGIGVLTASKDGFDRRTNTRYRKGGVIAHRYEVWRHNEDGTDEIVVQRATEQWHEIIPALIAADPRTPGHVPVMDRVEKENAVVEKANSDEWQGHHREMTEHLWRLVAERETGLKGSFGRTPGTS